MSRAINILNVKQINSLGKGRHADGGGLYLLVKNAGTRSWVFRYTRDGKTTDIGLGSATGMFPVSLKQARDKAAKCRDDIANGNPPQARRKSQIQIASDASANALPTFRECAIEYVPIHCRNLRNAKHEAQWLTSLENFAFDLIGDKPFNEITRSDVIEVLQKIWHTTPETARRVRGRMERVLDYAYAKYCDADATISNPAQYDGRMKAILIPAKSAVKHHAAIDFSELPTFMKELSGREAISARALEFAIFTATRTGETIGAKWSEINLDKALWTIPAARMKAHKEHVVPLSPDAIAVLQQLLPLKESDAGFVFRNFGEKKLSNMAMLGLLKRMGKTFTVHGMRSAFRDWAANQNRYDTDVCEMALAHTIENKVKAAYLRSDLIELRRELMNDWAEYLR